MEAGVTIAADTNRYRGVGLLLCIRSRLGSRFMKVEGGGDAMTMAD